MRGILFQERRTKVDKLATMLCTDNFAHYLFVDKGKRLLGKCIPTFNNDQTQLVLGFLMQYAYIISRNEIALDDIFTHINYAVDLQKFAHIVDIAASFVHLYSRHTHLYSTIFNNKFCLSFLLKCMSKSELVGQDDFEPEHKITWSAFINSILMGLGLVKPVVTKADGTNVYNVIESYSLNVKALIDNFDINKELWQKNEPILKELFTFV